jgi:hypothetical protein
MKGSENGEKYIDWTGQEANVGEIMTPFNGQKRGRIKM